MGKINSFRELRVYAELRRLHLEAHAESLRFPKFEMYELGSQLRRSSNAAPAIIAEGWGKMLEVPHRRLSEWRDSVRHPYLVREPAPDSVHAPGIEDWDAVERITLEIMDSP